MASALASYAVTVPIQPIIIGADNANGTPNVLGRTIPDPLAQSASLVMGTHSPS